MSIEDGMGEYRVGKDRKSLKDIWRKAILTCMRPGEIHRHLKQAAKNAAQLKIAPYPID